MQRAQRLIERCYEYLAAADVERLALMYADDAEIVRYDGVTYAPEVPEYYRRLLSAHGFYRLREIVQIRRHDDVVMWDALVDTEAGVLQTVDVVILDDEDRVYRHIPGIRGYWGG
jgi:hypothetical protein